MHLGRTFLFGRAAALALVIPLLARFAFDVDAGAFGLMNTVFGVGALVGAMYMAWRAMPGVRALLGFGFSFLRPMGYDYVDWKDPVPAIKATTDFTRNAVRQVIRRKLPNFRRNSS